MNNNILINYYSSIENRLINPILEASNMSIKAQIVAKYSIKNIILINLIKKILDTIPEQILNDLPKQFFKQNSKQKLETLQKIIEKIPEANKEICSYITTDLPEFTKELLKTFFEEASKEQKDIFSKLVNKT